MLVKWASILNKFQIKQHTIGSLWNFSFSKSPCSKNSLATKFESLKTGLLVGAGFVEGLERSYAIVTAPRFCTSTQITPGHEHRSKRQAKVFEKSFREANNSPTVATKKKQLIRWFEETIHSHRKWSFLLNRKKCFTYTSSSFSSVVSNRVLFALLTFSINVPIFLF